MKEADFLKLLDQLKYDLKVSDDRTPLMVGFEEVLNGYIERNNLGTDQHNFVTKPVISLDPKDMRVDSFRDSGSPLNEVNRMVRVTHIPSGIVVDCSSERWHHQNSYG